MKKLLILLAIGMLFTVTTAAASCPLNTVGCWPLNESSGQSIYDHSPEGNDGVRGTDSTSEQEDPSWLTASDCHSGTCLQFEDVDGDNDGDQFVTIRNDSSLHVDEVTASAWVYPTSFKGNHDRGILLKEREYKMALEKNTGQLLGSIRNDSCGWCGEDSGGWQESHHYVNKSEWTHVAFSWNLTHYKFYINNRLVDIDTPESLISGPTEIKDTNYSLGIGARDPLGKKSGPIYLFRGYIDEPRIFNESMDLATPKTTENYTDTGWKDTSQAVKLTCERSGRDCDKIEFRIRKSGSIVRQGNRSSTETTVDVGATTNGDLTLEYRGWDNARTESWDSQRVRVDTQDPTTQLPADPTWYSSDFTQPINESDTPSGITSCEYRTKDGSDPWSSWKSRSCGNVSVTVDGSGAECTTEGNDECGVRVRATDQAGNTETETHYYNIDLTPLDTDDNFSSTDWETEPQWVQLTCQDGFRDCNQIDWEITTGGNLVKSGTSAGTETAVLIGNNTDGELTLRYRGWDIYGNVETWEEQRVRIDTKGVTTLITDPNSSTWQTDDFKVVVDETQGGGSGLGKLDLYYLADTSISFYDEWDTLENKIHDIENEVENDTSVDIDRHVWGQNNTYEGAAADARVCMNGQSIDGDPHCDRYSPIIDDISDVEPYANWFGTSIQSYDPHTQPTIEAPTEGWGMAELDVLNRADWRNGTDKVVIAVGDHDTNGGHHSSGHASCGDSVSENLAFHLNTSMQSQDIHTFGLLGNAECSDDPSDGIHNSYAERQMNITGEVVHYSDSDELPDKIINILSQFQADQCYYRINDGGKGWTSWKQRDCPNGNVSVSVGTIGSGADCTTDGVDTCEVDVKVEDNAGHVDTDYQAFNIDAGPPTADDNYTDNGWKNEPQWIEITCSDPASGCARIDWRIIRSGTNVRNGTVFSDTAVVDVGSYHDGDLTLEYRGTDSSGNTGGWQSQDVRVDKVDPSTNITGPNGSEWLTDDFNVTIEDSDDGGSTINTGECEYRVKDGTDLWSPWQTRSCPDGNITITAGDDTTDECTTDGKNTCKVEIRLVDNAGNEDRDNASFNLDAGPPQIICDNGCAPDLVFPGAEVTFSPTIPDNQSSSITVNICDNADCQDITCGFDPSLRANCTGTAPDVPVRKEFHIVATDSRGRTTSVLQSYTVKGQVNDYCTQDKDCISGNCQENTCQPAQKPPIIEIYAGSD